jgi:hypothetical protein
MRNSAGSVLLAAVACLAAGCSDAPTAKAPAARKPFDYAAEDARIIREAMAKLSPHDRAKAEAQKICPVAEAPLGGMGMPYKMTVKGRDVFLCCEGCKGEIESDPDKYLAKLDKVKPGSSPSPTE